MSLLRANARTSARFRVPIANFLAFFERQQPEIEHAVFELGGHALSSAPSCCCSPLIAASSWPLWLRRYAAMRVRKASRFSGASLAAARRTRHGSTRCGKQAASCRPSCQTGVRAVSAEIDIAGIVQHVYTVHMVERENT